MGHRDPSEGESHGHFSMAAHADEWAEAMGDKAELMAALELSIAKREWEAKSPSEKFRLAFRSFRKGNPDQPTHRIYQTALMEIGQTGDERKADAMARFVVASNANVGDYIRCPGCNKKITKTSYQHKFCKEKRNGYSNCKDFINNWLPTKRLARTCEFVKNHATNAGTSTAGPLFGAKPADTTIVCAIDAKPVTHTTVTPELDMIKHWLTEGKISLEDLQKLVDK